MTHKENGRSKTRRSSLTHNKILLWTLRVLAGLTAARIIFGEALHIATEIGSTLAVVVLMVL